MGAGPEAARWNQEDFERFFGGMQFFRDVARDLQQRYAPLLAPSFSVFDYIDESETKLSRIFADLLNPRGTHGQGATFLEAFLRFLRARGCGVPEDLYQTETISVMTEAPTFGGRKLDILIELSRRFWIAVENKPWAAEQPNQLHDYREDLERRSLGDAFILLFLTRDGRSPRTARHDWSNLVEARRAANLSFDDLRGWLADCMQRCQADKVRHFLGDLQSYLEKNLYGPPTQEQVA